MDFSDGFNFTVRLHPVYLAQTDKRECVGAGEMDFSSGVNFTVCLHPACLCKRRGRETTLEDRTLVENS